MAARVKPPAVAILAAVLALAGCSAASDVTGYALVMQDRYIFQSCAELAVTRTNYTTRRNELIGLLEKAESGGIGGAIVGATTYRSELEQVRAHLMFIAKTEQQKGCGASDKR